MRQDVGYILIDDEKNFLWPKVGEMRNLSELVDLLPDFHTTGQGAGLVGQDDEPLVLLGFGRHSSDGSLVEAVA